MSVIGSGNIVEEYLGSNNMLTSAMQARLLKLRKNDRIIFEDIVGMGPDGLPVKLSALLVKVK